MASKEDLIDPELEWCDDSEIQAVIDLGLKGEDGIERPILINQEDEDFLALTLEDSERLYDFLGKAIPHIKNYRNSKEFVN